MEWLILSLIATALWAVSNTIDKIVLEEYIKRPIFCSVISGFLGFLFAIAVFLIFQVQIISPISLMLSLIEGAVYISGILFYFKALSIEEVTRIAPLLQTIPLFTLFLSVIFLNEILVPMQYTGIIFIIVGALSVSFKKNESSIKPNKAFWLILFSSFLFGVSWVLSKYILNMISYWNFFFWSRIGGFIMIILLLVIVPSYRKLGSHIKNIPKNSFSLLAISEIINLLALFIATIALSKGLASIVSTITSSQPLFVLLYAFFLTRHFPKIFKIEVEKTSLMVKLGASILIIVGFFLIGGGY